MRGWLIGLALAASGACSACTIIFVARGGQVFAAGNEDEENRPEVSKHTIRFVPPDKEKGALGYVAFGYERNPFSDESAMNEAGLFYDFDALDKLDLPRADKPKGKFNAFNEMLKTCKTVEEAVKYLESVDLPNFSAAQAVIGDASGASAIVERHATTWRRKDRDFQIGTNFRTSTTPTESIACDRYKLCEKILTKNRPVRVKAVADMLKQTAANPKSGYATWYSVICDLKQRQVHLYLKGDFGKVRKFSLTDELKKGPQKLDMESFFSRGR